VGHRKKADAMTITSLTDDRPATSDPTYRHHRASRLAVRVRPIRPDDLPLVADLFARLSPASRLARFLAPKRHLTTAELHYFTDIDHHNHEALIAITRLRGEPVGVIRFIRDLTQPTSAEIAVEVVDEWQNIGIGSLLVTRLAARARRENVTEFTAMMGVDNTRSRRLLTKLGDTDLVARDGATVTYRTALPTAAPARAERGATPCAFAGCA
jgi:RimJ/RimL family protein N-acetyltransferase